MTYFASPGKKPRQNNVAQKKEILARFDAAGDEKGKDSPPWRGLLQ